MVLGFKSLADTLLNPLPALAPAITPPPTLAGVPALLFAETKEIVVRPTESANTNTEELAPTRAHNRSIAELFARSKQNELSKASQAVSIRPSPRDNLVWSNPPNATLQEHGV